MERGFQIFLLESLLKFRFGINPYDFMGYIQHYFPYHFDSADPFEGFSEYTSSLHENKLIEGNSEKIWISEKGRNLVKDFNKKFYSYDIVNFYKQCLDNFNPTAPISLIYDSQTKKVLEEIFQNNEHPVILDYGCGKMRLLNALFHELNNIEWHYIGVDTKNPKFLNPLEYSKLKKIKQDEKWEICTINEARKFKNCADVVVLMNVMHELPIVDLASAIEDSRQWLNKDGWLIVVDTVFVRKGEPKFVPFFPWEIEKLFNKYVNNSYRTKSDIPIAFFVIHQNDIPYFHDILPIVHNITIKKLSILLELKDNIRTEKNSELLQELGVGINKIFDYGYVNDIIANVNSRIEEYDLYRITDNVDQAGFDILSWSLKSYEISGYFPSPLQIYDKFADSYTHMAIKYVLDSLTSIPRIFFKHKQDEPLVASEVFDILCDEIGFGKISNQGLQRALLEASLIKEQRYM